MFASRAGVLGALSLLAMVGSPLPSSGDVARAEYVELSESRSTASDIDRTGLVARPNRPPTICHLRASLYHGYLVVTGKVVDDEDPAGWTVRFRRSVSGTATVRSDGTFTFVALYGYGYGEVSASTTDRYGARSPRVVVEFHE